MKKRTRNQATDILAFLGFIFLASTGVLMAYTLPPGSGQASFLGLTRHGWGDLHFWAAVGFVGLISLHLLWHWRPIVSWIRGNHAEGNAGRNRLATGITGVVLLISLVIAPFFVSVETGVGDGHGPGRMEREHASESIVVPPFTVEDFAYVVGVQPDVFATLSGSGMMETGRMSVGEWISETGVTLDSLRVRIDRAR